MTAAPNPPAPGGPGGHHAPNSTGTAEPAASSPRRAISAISRRSAHLLRQTPGRLALALTFILALTAVSGATSATDAGARADLIDEVSGQQGRMSVAAFDMYRALSDADSAATEAFLPGRTSQDARDGDYEDGVGRATSALVTLSAEASTKDQTSLVAELSAALPTYTGLVETARTYHRQQLPLGLAYLNNASALVHQEMLPTIKRLQNSAMDDLRAAKDDAVGFPWLATIAVVLLLALLAYWQMWLTRHTNRFVNVGLAAATLVVLIAAVWSLVAWGGAAGHMNDGHSQGAEPLAVLSDAHIGAQQARGNEALTLVAQGAGTDYEAEFVQIMDELIGPDGDGGVLAEVKADFDDEELTGHVDAAIAAAGEWRSAHEDLRAADDSGDYDTAVASAVGDEVGDAGRAFAALDAALTEANAVAADRFASETDAAGRALGGLGTGVGVITLIAMIAAALGLQRRISEYR